MDNFRIDWFDSVSNCESETDYLDLIEKMCDQLGFEYAAYGARMPVNITKPQTVMLNNYPELWRQMYAERNYLAVDPTVEHALNSIYSVTWEESLFVNQREFYEEARSHGLKYGWAQPIYDGRVCALVTFARSESALNDDELHEKHENMMWLAQAIHTSIGIELINQSCPEMTSSLTSREKEVVTWTAEGKTAEEIGVILSISTRTVNFHIGNVMTKLHSYNKTSATIKAVQLGLV